MDFTRTEILNPNAITLARAASVDTIDPIFDSDLDVIFSKNGAILTLATPITNYQWVEFEIENLGNQVNTLSISALKNNIGTTTNANKADFVGGLAPRGKLIYKLANIGVIEQFFITVGSMTSGDLIAIKRITVANKNSLYSKAISSSITFGSMAGWAYDATLGRYSKTFTPLEAATVQVTAALAKIDDYLNVHIWTTSVEPFQLQFLVLDGRTGSIFAQDVEFDLSGDPLLNVWPNNININAGFSGGPVFLEFRYGTFPTQSNVFSGLAAQPSALPNWTPNMGLPIAGLTGYMKVAAGILSAVLTIPAADVSGILTVPQGGTGAVAFTVGTYIKGNGAGILATQVGVPWADIIGYPGIGGPFLDEALNLSDLTNVVTARANLGLGASALHSDAFFLQSANNLSDVANVATARTNLGLGTGNSPTHVGMTLSGLTAASVLFAGAGGLISQDNASFSYSSVNKQLSISQGINVGPTASNVNTNIYQGSISAAITSATPTVFNALGSVPATSVGNAAGFRSALTTAAAAFTIPDLAQFSAEGIVKGAGSAVTNAYGFRTLNLATIGAVNTYAFHTAIAAATGSFAYYGAGTAPSYLGGNLTVGSGVNPNVDYTLYVGRPQGTGSGQRCIQLDAAFPATTTSQAQGVMSNITTAAAAYTLTSLIHFYAFGAAKGAGSTVTNAYGFWAQNGIAIGGTNYGYYCDINNATNTYQLYLSGTAESLIKGGLSLGILSAIAQNAFLFIGDGGANVWPNSTGMNGFGINITATTPSTMTNGTFGCHVALSTVAVAFTSVAMVGFNVNSWFKGAGSTVADAIGFRAVNGFAVGTNNYGFWSDLSAAANKYQLYMGGTAKSLFAGLVVMSTATLAEALITVTYSAAMTVDASLGNSAIITVTDGVAHTINAPTNPTTGQSMEITIRNTFGVIGVATWNAVFKMVAWVQPANGFSRSIRFRYNGTNWIERMRSAADVPN